VNAGAEDPRVSRSRARILEAARECFAEHGYDATTVETIAARAGIAKRTVFNVFGDKDAVFRAAVEASFPIAERFAADLRATFDAALREAEDPADALPRVAVRLARDVFLGPVVRLRRLVAREADRFPDLAEQYRLRAPYAVIRTLAEGFAALAARGALAAPDPRLAAEHFAFLVLGPELGRRMLGDAPADAAAIEAAARAGAAVLRAYLPPR
jgi:TetR/AcrR family transcriptional regulator, mexJK operon transcriptional repressor